MKPPSAQSPLDVNRLAPVPGVQASARRSLDKGDIPTQVLDRYLIERDRQGRPERFYRDNKMSTPMFRDHGRSLSTSLNYPDAVSDMIKVARHRGWDQIRVAGDEGFRCEVWVQAKALGLDVKGYRPTERDRQAGAEGATPARSPVPSRKSGIEKDGELAMKRRLDMAAAVVRSLIADPAAQARLMDRAWARIAPAVARAEPDKTRSGDGNQTRRRER